MTRRSAAYIGLSASVAALLFSTTAVRAVESKDIVDTAVSAGSFKTLAAAATAAGLVDTLKGEGPFTVFAPNDKAFEALEKAHPGTIASLLKPQNKQKLVSILTYHVVAGRVLAKDVVKLANGAHVKTVNGKSLVVRNKHGVKVGNAKVVKTDIVCSNGVIHVIDRVLLPK